jgi:hypothetical protein
MDLSFDLVTIAGLAAAWLASRALSLGESGSASLAALFTDTRKSSAMLGSWPRHTPALLSLGSYFPDLK